MYASAIGRIAAGQPRPGGRHPRGGDQRDEVQPDPVPDAPGEEHPCESDGSPDQTFRVGAGDLPERESREERTHDDVDEVLFDPRQKRPDRRSILAGNRL